MKHFPAYFFPQWSISLRRTPQPRVVPSLDEEDLMERAYDYVWITPVLPNTQGQAQPRGQNRITELAVREGNGQNGLPPTLQETYDGHPQTVQDLGQAQQPHVYPPTSNLREQYVAAHPNGPVASASNQQQRRPERLGPGERMGIT
jgi:hypothetical protein